MGQSQHQPVLHGFYQQYLNDEDSASFVDSVSLRYTTPTLERLAVRGARVSRRAAALALGLLGDFRSNAAMGSALHDSDRGVRMLAENGIRELWCRDGTETQQQRLNVILRLNSTEQFSTAEESAGELIDEAPWFAEAWNQRAIARFQLDRFEASAGDCHQTLELNPYHFAAAVGMGHCYLELHLIARALECFQRALRLNPGMENVRAQVEYLQRSM